MFTKPERKDSIFGFVSGTTGLYLPCTVWILEETIHSCIVINLIKIIYELWLTLLVLEISLRLLLIACIKIGCRKYVF